MTIRELNQEAARRARAYLAEQAVECPVHTSERCVLRTVHPDGTQLAVVASAQGREAVLAAAWDELRVLCERYYADQCVDEVVEHPAERLYEPGGDGRRLVNDWLVSIKEPPAHRDEIFAAARPLLLRGSSAPAPTVHDVVVAIQERRARDPQLRLGA